MVDNPTVGILLLSQFYLLASGERFNFLILNFNSTVTIVIVTSSSLSFYFILFIHNDVHLIRRNFTLFPNNCSVYNLINNKTYIYIVTISVVKATFYPLMFNDQISCEVVFIWPEIQSKYPLTTFSQTSLPT